MKAYVAALLILVFSLGAKECDLTLVGPVRMADGIGRQTPELIEALCPELSISFIKSRLFEKRDVAKPVKNIFKNSGVENPGKVLIFEDLIWAYLKKSEQKKIFWKNFKLREDRTDQIRLAYTMAESSQISNQWVQFFNQHFDALLVPDEFLVEVYKSSGIRIPVFTLPLGLNLQPYFNAQTQKTKTFTFANFSSCFPRKNLLKLVQAFDMAFHNRPNVQLKLCCRRTSGSYLPTIKKEIRKRKIKNIVLATKRVDEKTYLDRFLSVNCYVNIAVGEGFSIQPREAMALGIPVIVSDNSAQTTIANSELVRVVPSTIPVSSKKVWGKKEFGVFKDCRVEDVADALKDMYEHYDHYCENCDAAREWVRQYDYNNIKNLYKNIVKPKYIVVGGQDKILENGFMTSSKEFAEKYQRLLNVHPSS